MRIEATQSPITAKPAAAADLAIDHLASWLAFETDCWDVHESVRNNDDGFLLIDVRSPDLYETGHVPER